MSPVPVSGISKLASSASLLVIVSRAERAPLPLGVKVMSSPALVTVGVSVVAVSGVVMAKSPAFAPVTMAVSPLSSPTPVPVLRLRTTTDCLKALPTRCSPKLTVVTLSVSDWPIGDSTEISAFGGVAIAAVEKDMTSPNDGSPVLLARTR